MDEIARTAKLSALHTYLKKALKDKYSHIVSAHIANAEIAGLSGTEASLRSLEAAIPIPKLPALSITNNLRTPLTPVIVAKKKVRAGSGSLANGQNEYAPEINIRSTPVGTVPAVVTTAPAVTAPAVTTTTATPGMTPGTAQSQRNFNAPIPRNLDQIQLQQQRRTPGTNMRSQYPDDMLPPGGLGSSNQYGYQGQMDPGMLGRSGLTPIGSGTPVSDRVLSERAQQQQRLLGNRLGGGYSVGSGGAYSGMGGAYGGMGGAYGGMGGMGYQDQFGGGYQNQYGYQGQMDPGAMMGRGLTPIGSGTPVSDRILSERAQQQQRILGERMGGSGVRLGPSIDDLQARREQMQMGMGDDNYRSGSGSGAWSGSGSGSGSRYSNENRYSPRRSDDIHSSPGSHHSNDIRYSPRSRHPEDISTTRTSTPTTRDLETEEYEREMKALFHAAEDSKVSDALFNQMVAKIRAKHSRHADLDVRIDRAERLRKARADPRLLEYKKNMEGLFALARNPKTSESQFQAAAKRIRGVYKDKTQILNRIASAEKLYKKTIEQAKKPPVTPKTPTTTSQTSADTYKNDIRQLYKLAENPKSSETQYQALFKKVSTRYADSAEVKDRLARIETLHKAARGDARAKYRHDMQKLFDAAANPKTVSETAFQSMIRNARAKHAKEQGFQQLLVKVTERRKDALAKHGPGGLKAVACAKLGVKTGSPSALCNAATGKPLPDEKQPKGIDESRIKKLEQMKENAKTLLQLARDPVKKKDQYTASLAAFKGKYEKEKDGRDIIKRAERLHASMIPKKNSANQRSAELRYKHEMQVLFNVAKLGHQDGKFEAQWAKVQKLKDYYAQKNPNVKEFIEKRLKQAKDLHDRMKVRNQQRVRDKQATREKQEKERLLKQQKLEQQKKQQAQAARATQEQRNYQQRQKIIEKQTREFQHKHPLKTLQPKQLSKREKARMGQTRGLLGSLRRTPTT